MRTLCSLSWMKLQVAVAEERNSPEEQRSSRNRRAIIMMPHETGVESGREVHRAWLKSGPRLQVCW